MSPASSLLERMCKRVLRHATGPRDETALPGVSIGFVRSRGTPTNVSCQPGVCLVLQGAKSMLVGGELLRYGAGGCFASLLELPATRCTTHASAANPYVATGLRLDHEVFASLLAEAPRAHATASSASSSSFAVVTASPALLEAWGRYLALLDTPEDIPALASPRARELAYRLLQSEYGPMLRQLARDDGRLARVRRAMTWIRDHYDERITTTTLAKLAKMSVPAFHRNFREATAMSPLQYPKTLRLQAARRLLATDADAGHTAYAVGYESASQFSREYARFFGLPPKQDAARLRGDLTNATSLP